MTQTPRSQDELYRSPVETAIDLAQEALEAEDAWEDIRTASSIHKEASSMTKNELEVAEEAWMELVAAVQQMAPADDQIICNHVRRAEGLLRALVMIRKEQGGPK